MNIRLSFFIFCFFVFTIACKTTKNINTPIDNCNVEKIKFDLNLLDKRGLVGDNENKVGLDYEFCIPNQEDKVNEVLSIDTSIKKVQTKGRSACSKTELLMVGSTFNKNYKRILCRISQLEYVEEIKRTYWE